jgi:hypothetical protein
MAHEIKLDGPEQNIKRSTLTTSTRHCQLDDVLLLKRFPGWLSSVAKTYLDYMSHERLGQVCLSIRLDVHWGPPNAMRHIVFASRLQHLTCFSRLHKRHPRIYRSIELLGMRVRTLLPHEPCLQRHCILGNFSGLPSVGTPCIPIVLQQVSIVSFQAQQLSTGTMAWNDDLTFSHGVYDEYWLSLYLGAQTRCASLPCAVNSQANEAAMSRFRGFLEQADRFPFDIVPSRRWKRRNACKCNCFANQGNGCASTESTEPFARGCACLDVLAAKYWSPSWNKHDCVLTAAVGCPWHMIFNNMRTASFDIKLLLRGFITTRSGDGRQRLRLDLTIEHIQESLVSLVESATTG